MARLARAVGLDVSPGDASLLPPPRNPEPGAPRQPRRTACRTLDALSWATSVGDELVGDYVVNGDNASKAEVQLPVLHGSQPGNLMRGSGRPGAIGCGTGSSGILPPLAAG
jgi:hypothetical protein